MRVLDRDELKAEENKIIDAVRKGAVFIYPTDTIYGIGCNAQNSGSVLKIRKIKKRAEQPFSVIAPSVEWIRKNCIVSQQGEEWLEKLPGPYTLIFRLRSKCVAKEVNPRLDTLGVRIPSHWISKFAAKAEVPIVTTSVNQNGQDYMTSLEDLDGSIKGSVDFALYEGAKKGKPSRIVDLMEKAKVIER